MRVLSILLAVMFLLLGTSKVAGASAMAWSHRFERWGYPAAAAPATGVAEVMCGICILFRKTRPFAAGAIVILMAGAMATHVVHGEYLRVLPPLLFAIVASVIAVYT